MRQKFLLISVLSLILGLISAVSAQGPEEKVKLGLATGDVVSVDTGKIVLQTKDGALDVTLSDKTQYKRVSAESPSLKTAAAAAFSDIGTGDKLVVTGMFSADKKTLPAHTVYLMTKGDIAQKQSKESDMWRTRGVSGRVVSVDAQTNKINIEMRGLANTTTVAVTAKPDAKFKRYAPNSIKYSEAVASSLNEVKPGDMLRALGEKSADGASFTAEEVLTGAFQTVAGTVKSIDAAKNEVVISDIQTKKDVTVAVGATSLLKKFPEEFAQRMASMQAGGGVRPGGQGGQNNQSGQSGQNAAPAGNSPAGEGQSGGMRRGGGPGGMRGGQGGIDEMLERFPSITVADLKVGDQIAVSSTKNAAGDRITAIKLLAGVEPFLKSATAAGSQNSGGQRGGQGGFTIPGLDGFDNP